MEQCFKYPCTENIIGIRGVCQSPFDYYLDDIGISLKMVAKGTDEKWKNARELINRKIDLAWQEVFSDVKIKGKNISGDIIFQGDTGTNAGTSPLPYNGENFTLTLSKDCKLATMFLNGVYLFGNGTNVIVTINDVVYTVGTLVDVAYISVNEYAESFNVTMEGDDLELFSFRRSTSRYITMQGNKGISFDYMITCTNEKWICKFVKQLAKAALYKAGAMIWKEVDGSNVWNELIELKRDSAITEMAWLDSSYNLLKYDPATTDQYRPKGLYQIEIEKIQLPEPTGCGCCLKCDGDNYVLTLP